LAWAARYFRVGTIVLAASVATLSARRASAEGTESAPPASSAEPNREQPERHFERALAAYRAGRYREAVRELDAALALDPNSKDLVYDLALVHEKLGDLEQAIAALERYQELEQDEVELARARQAIERMRGARRELRPAPDPWTRPAPPSDAAHAANGWLIATTSVAAAAAVVGVVFGVRALVLRPGDDATTRAGANIETLRERQASAERSANVADISFAISVLAGAGSAVLWLRDSPSCPRTSGVARAPLGLVLRTSF
jgi:tetratricopeptide (TPR) repeat protein